MFYFGRKHSVYVLERSTGYFRATPLPELRGTPFHLRRMVYSSQKTRRYPSMFYFRRKHSVYVFFGACVYVGLPDNGGSYKNEYSTENVDIGNTGAAGSQ